MGSLLSKKSKRRTETPSVFEESIEAVPTMYVALYDYEARADNDMSFNEKDQLEILEDEGDWWFARNSEGKEGWIPNNYVAPYASLTAEPWFVSKMSRPQADKLLKHPRNKAGAFLIRGSDSQPGQYSLSVKHQNSMMHYRIRTLDNGGYFISQMINFRTLQELVQHYSKAADGLCCALAKPCVSIEKPIIEGLTKDKWEIPRNELQKGDLLGQGQFGEVFKGYWNKKIVVAIKMLRADATDVAQFLQEAQLMKTLCHPKLVQLYGVCTVDIPVLIVTEFMVNGALLDYLQTDIGQQLSTEVLIDMAAQVAAGMAFLEKNNYIHRDLAARNVLVAEEDIVKIADFGLARIISDDVYEARVGAKFPVKWTAPEAVNFQKYSIKSDVWSFGILMTELVTYGRIPYPGMSNQEVIQLLSRGYRMECPQDCPEDLYALMLQCWDKDPQKRPTFESLQYTLDEFSSIGSQYC